MLKGNKVNDIKRVLMSLLCIILLLLLSKGSTYGKDNNDQPKKKPIVSTLRKPAAPAKPAGSMKKEVEADDDEMDAEDEEDSSDDEEEADSEEETEADEQQETKMTPSEKRAVKADNAAAQKPAAPTRPPMPPRPAPVASPIPPQPGNPPKTNIAQQGEFITLDFKGEVKDLITMFSDLMGKNMIYDDTFRDKITIIAPKKLSKEEAWNVFLSVLDYRGYNVIESKESIRIVKALDARQGAIDTILGKDGKELPDSAQLITYVTHLQYASAEQIKGAVAQLVSPKTGTISSYSPTNTLIISDTAENIKRLLKIIDAIDVAGLEERPVITVLPLKNASAKSLSSELKDILEQALKLGVESVKGAKPGTTSGGGKAEGPKIIPDERLNALIIVADLQTTKRIEELLEKLDSPVEKGTSKVNVYYLNNAVAEDLAGVLNGIVSKAPKAGTTGAAKPGEAQPSAPLFGRDVIISADKSTNALIISASAEDYLLLKDIIAKLDIMKAQVFVESLIVEVSENKMVQLGVELNLLKDLEDASNPLNKVRAIGLTNFSSLQGLLSTTAGKIPTLPSGASVAITKGLITLADGTQVLNIAALGTALATQSGVNVLAQPQIITADNEEAEITVGENRRFIRSSTIVSDTANTVNTFEFRDVALNLKLTPHINKDGFVKMTVEQKVENVIPGSTSDQGVETSKREAKTTVVVKDMETIVIGGLIRETNSPSITKIPCLGDLPWIGWFFSQTSNTKEKTNLLIFLKPTIINTPVEFAKLSKDKKEVAKKFREDDENKKDIFYRTIIDGKYKFWKDDAPIPMLDDQSKLLEQTPQKEQEPGAEEKAPAHKTEVKKPAAEEMEVKPTNKSVTAEEMKVKPADKPVLAVTQGPEKTEAEKKTEIPPTEPVVQKKEEPILPTPVPGPPAE